jgi:hypothetical protein
VSPKPAQQRLETAERELYAAVRDGRSRDAASWQIAVEVLRHGVEDQPA